MSVEKWVDVASWLGDSQPVASGGRPSSPGIREVSSSPRQEKRRGRRTKNHPGPWGARPALGERRGRRRGYCLAKGTKRGGRGGEACPRESRGRSRRRGPAMSGNLPQGTRWREAASQAVELAEGQVEGTSGQRATRKQRRRIATWHCSEAADQGAGCLNGVRLDLWRPRVGNRPRLSGLGG